MPNIAEHSNTNSFLVTIPCNDTVSWGRPWLGEGREVAAQEMVVEEVAKGGIEFVFW